MKSSVIRVLKPLKWSGKEYQVGEYLDNAEEYPYLNSLINQRVVERVEVIDTILELPNDQLKILETTGTLPLIIGGKEYILSSIELLQEDPETIESTEDDSDKETEDSDDNKDSDKPEEPTEKTLCKHIKDNGEQCKKVAGESGYCNFHEEAMKRNLVGVNN